MSIDMILFEEASWFIYDRGEFTFWVQYILTCCSSHPEPFENNSKKCFNVLKYVCTLSGEDVTWP